jgi:hypothetical protein
LRERMMRRRDSHPLFIIKSYEFLWLRGTGS